MLPQLLYDADCGFCTQSARIGERMINLADERNATVIPHQRVDLSAWGITAERAQRELIWIGSKGDVLGGVDAVAAWLRYRKAWPRILGDLLVLPGVRHLAYLIYPIIAANRHRLPGGTASCQIPPATDQHGKASKTPLPAAAGEPTNRF